MRKLLVLTVIVLIAILGGWVTLSRSPGKASFTIETQKISDDAKHALEESKRLLQKDGEHVDGEPVNDPAN